MVEDVELARLPDHRLGLFQVHLFAAAVEDALVDRLDAVFDGAEPRFLERAEHLAVHQIGPRHRRPRDIEAPPPDLAADREDPLLPDIERVVVEVDRSEPLLPDEVLHLVDDLDRVARAVEAVPVDDLRPGAEAAPERAAAARPHLHARLGYPPGRVVVGVHREEVPRRPGEGIQLPVEGAPRGGPRVPCRVAIDEAGDAVRGSPGGEAARELEGGLLVFPDEREVDGGVQAEEFRLEGEDVEAADRDPRPVPDAPPHGVDDAEVLRERDRGDLVDQEVGVEGGEPVEIRLVGDPLGAAVDHAHLEAVAFQHRRRVGEVERERHVAAALVLEMGPAGPGAHAVVARLAPRGVAEEYLHGKKLCTKTPPLYRLKWRLGISGDVDARRSTHMNLKNADTISPVLRTNRQGMNVLIGLITAGYVPPGLHLED